MDKHNVRKMGGRNVDDPNTIAANTYNEQAGAQKQTNAGQHLKPINIDGTTYTCNLTTARGIGKGKTLAVYNNSGSLGSITLGTDNTVTVLASGVVSGSNAGIACKPNDWTYIAVYDMQFAIASAATLLCYVVDDYTYITDQNNQVS